MLPLKWGTSILGSLTPGALTAGVVVVDMPTSIFLVDSEWTVSASLS